MTEIEGTGEASRSSAKSGGLSRRDLIKRAAIAGGIVWAAPVVMSIDHRAGAQTLGGSPCVCDGGKYWAAKIDSGDANPAKCTSVPNNNQDCSAVTDWLGTPPNKVGPSNNGTTAACSQLTLTDTTYNGKQVVRVTVPDGCKILGACAKYGGANPCAVAPINDQTVVFYKNLNDNPFGQCGSTGAGGGTGLSHYELAWCCC